MPRYAVDHIPDPSNPDKMIEVVKISGTPPLTEQPKKVTSLEEMIDELRKQISRVERKIDYFASQFAVRRKPVIDENGNFKQEIIMLDSLINNKISIENNEEITDEKIYKLTQEG